MDILKFGILGNGDEVVRVDINQIHVKKSTGEYAVYTMKLDTEGQIIDFDVLAITKGFGSFGLVHDADLNELADIWSTKDE